MGSAGPQRGARERSGQRRTSTGELPSGVGSAGPQPPEKKLPEDMSERVAENMPERMSEDMLGRASVPGAWCAGAWRPTQSSP